MTFAIDMGHGDLLNNVAKLRKQIIIRQFCGVLPCYID